MQRRNESYLRLYNCKDLEEILSLVENAYKIFLENKKNRKTKWLNILKDKKYKNILLKLVVYIGKLLDSYDVKSLKKAEVMKIFFDYFIALDSYYIHRGFNGFYFNQLISVNAMDIYMDWIESNFLSYDRYLMLLLGGNKVMSKGSGNVIDKSVLEGFLSNVVLHKSRVEGLMEIDFNL